MRRSLALSLSLFPILCAGLCGLGRQVVATELASALASIQAPEIQSHIDVLADDSFEGREAGSRGGRAAALYLVKQLEKLGLQGAAEGGSFIQEGHSGLRNVLAVLQGSDPELSDQYVLLGAHYDHVGYGNRKNSYGPFGYVHNGADDNASGVAGLLEVIEAFCLLETPPKRSLLFAFWDGEEKGLMGSKYWASHPTLPMDQIAMAFNADMIGRLREDEVKVFGTRTSAGLRRVVSQSNRVSDLHVDFDWELKANSDHHTFFARRIPVLMLHTGLHDNYHRPSDDAHLINHAGASRVAQLLFSIAHHVADGPGLDGFRSQSQFDSPADHKRLEQAMPPRAKRLAVTWKEYPGDQPGLSIVGVGRGSTAEQAGLQVGDHLLSFNGAPIANEGDLAIRLLASESPAILVIQRETDETLEVSVELAGSKLRLGVSYREDAGEPGVVLMSEVVPGSAASQAGLNAGDRIYQVAGQNFADGPEFLQLVTSLPGPLELLVERRGRLRTLLLDVPAIE